MEILALQLFNTELMMSIPDVRAIYAVRGRVSYYGWVARMELLLIKCCVNGALSLSTILYQAYGMMVRRAKT